MPPLLGLCGLVALLVAWAGSVREEGASVWLVIGGVTWSVAFFLAAYAAWNPRGTRRIQGFFALHFAFWMAVGAVASLLNETREVESWLIAAALVLMSLGAWAFGVGCVKKSALVQP